MQMNYQGALAIVHEYGKLGYFITVTANPTWTDIASNLALGDHAINRPDLVVRVYNLKLKALQTDLVERHILGTVVAYCWTVEFQKRGLPHAHILLVMRPEDKPVTPAAVDRVVSAELPDDSDPEQAELFQSAATFLLHGLCGQLTPTSIA